jgi:hypothetical protein
MPVVTTPAQVANAALSLTGSRVTIDSLDEDTAEAAACKVLYGTVRARCLSDYHWPFALKREILAPLTGQDYLTADESSGYGFTYALPVKCLVPRSIYPGTRNPGSGEPIPFIIEVKGDGSGLMLRTDAESPAILEYTYDAPEALWPAHFVEAVAYALAVPLAATLRAQPGVLAGLEQMARLRLHAAAAVEQNKRQADPRPDSEFITVR